LNALDLRDGDPVGREEDMARRRMLEAAFAKLPASGSAAIDLARKDLKVRLGQLPPGESPQASFGAEYDAAFRHALRAARDVLLAMRDSGEIGDDAFHALENDLDWMEVSDPLRSANADSTG
jgi:CPA1 family monovalent cation:H+ antiporter